MVTLYVVLDIIEYSKLTFASPKDTFRIKARFVEIRLLVLVEIVKIHQWFFTISLILSTLKKKLEFS